MSPIGCRVDLARSKRLPVRPLSALPLLLFFSGASLLMFETVWSRVAARALGGSVPAWGAVLGSLMAGLALGSALARRAGRSRTPPLRLCAGVHILCAVSGLVLVLLLARLGPACAALLRDHLDRPSTAAALRVLVALPMLLVPAAAFGMVVPLALAARADGASLGRLYGASTLGSAAGALAGEALARTALGLLGTATAAAVVALLVAVGFALARSPEARPSEPVERQSSPAARGLVAAGALLGALFLGHEIVWLRVAALHVPGNDLAFSVLVAVVLVGSGAGALLASRTTTRAAVPAALAAGVGSAAAYSALPAVLHRLDGVAGALGELAYTAVVSAALVLPTATASGVAFACVARARQHAAPRAAGAFLAANTLGAAGGALGVAFVGLPTLGVERCLFGLAVGYAAVSVVLWLGRARPVTRSSVATTLCAATALVVALAQFPFDSFARAHLARVLSRFSALGELEPGAVREGLAETLVLVRHRRFGGVHHERLVSNAHSMSSTALPDRRYMSAFALLPLAVHPAPRRALLIGYGLGVTARVLLDAPELARLDVADPSAETIAMSALVAIGPGEPLRDPRVRLHREDARFFLQSTDACWDVITGEPPPPKNAGIAALFTAEHFALVRSRLCEGGIATYWLPAHDLVEGEAAAITRAFCASFADCALFGASALDWMLVGTRGARGPVSPERFSVAWTDPRRLPAAIEAGFDRPAQLAATFLADAPDLAGLTEGRAPLDDDHPGRIGSWVPTAVSPHWALARWLDPALVRARFARSAALARLVPAAVRERAALDLPLEANLRELQLGVSVPVVTALARVHDAIGRQAPTAALWLLGSDPRSQALAREARVRREHHAGMHYHLAVGALVAGNPGGAVRELEAELATASPEAPPRWSSHVLSVLIYAQAAGAGRARAVELVRRALPPDDASAAALLRWLDDTFP